MNFKHRVLGCLALAVASCFTVAHAEPDWGASCGVGQPGEFWFSAGYWFGG